MKVKLKIKSKIKSYFLSKYKPAWLFRILHDKISDFLLSKLTGASRFEEANTFISRVTFFLTWCYYNVHNERMKAIGVEGYFHYFNFLIHYRSTDSYIYNRCFAMDKVHYPRSS
jgi:hypothetical protein